AETATRVSAAKNLEIWVDRSGNLYLNGYPSDLALIETGVMEAYKKEPDTRVHVIADRDTPFENVNRVLAMLQLLEYRSVSFVVKNNGQ
ncbi:MAG: biopolymer transporter ExbD, partial [Treponema sp.]|nr:biopolymer transporter ExbD [Treponema sp.]